MTTIAEYYALKPADFGPIVSLEFRQRKELGEPVAQELEIILSRRPNLGADRLRLRFFGVRDLTFTQRGWTPETFGLIEIRDLSDGLRVAEDEGNLKFTCTTFEASHDPAGQGENLTPYDGMDRAPSRTRLPSGSPYGRFQKIGLARCGGAPGAEQLIERSRPFVM
jgi:hypothetical protein